MAKLIFMDLDDTLFGQNKRVSAYSRTVLERAAAQGIHLFCATARGVMAWDLLPRELFSGGVLASGAIVEVGGRRVYDRTIPPETAERVLRELDALGLQAGAEIERAHYVNFNIAELWSHYEDHHRTDFSDLPCGSGKLYARLERPEQEQAIAAILPPELYYRVNRDGLAFILHREAEKGRAARAAADALGLDLADAIAFGDDVTDIGMLQACGLGVAMENALDEVKAAADRVCGNNREDGVARFIEEFLLK